MIVVACLAAVTVAVFVTVPTSVYFVAYLLLLMILNVTLISHFSKQAVSYILFPFANSLMIFQYHISYNERMILDVQKNYKVANDLIQQTMNKPKFTMLETMKDYSSKVKQLSKMCDYINLFSKVNRELIQDDLNKKAKRKRTRRYPISDLFVRFTKAMERVNAVIKEIKVVSISEIAHDEGCDLPWNEQPIHADEGRLLSVFQHFNDLEAIERNHKDVREYLTKIENKEKPEEGGVTMGKVLKYERCLPIIYKPRGKEEQVEKQLA